MKPVRYSQRLPSSNTVLRMTRLTRENTRFYNDVNFYYDVINDKILMLVSLC